MDCWRKNCAQTSGYGCHIAASIQHKYGIPVVPHVVCGGFTREETENMLIDLNFLGIKISWRSVETD